MQEFKKNYKKIIVLLGVIACILSKDEIALAQQRIRQQNRSVRPIARTPQRSRAQAPVFEKQPFYESFYPIGLSPEQYHQLTLDQVSNLESLFNNNRESYNKAIQRLILLPQKTQKPMYQVEPKVLKPVGFDLHQEEELPDVQKKVRRRTPQLQPSQKAEELKPIKRAEELKPIIDRPRLVMPELKKEEIVQVQAQPQKQELVESVKVDPFKEVLGKYSSGFFSKAPSVFVYLKKGLQKDLEQIEKGKEIHFAVSADFVKAVEFLKTKTDNLQSLNLSQYTDSLALFVQNYKELLEACQEYAQAYVANLLQKPRPKELQEKIEKNLEIFLKQCYVLIAQYNQFVKGRDSLFRNFVLDIQNDLKKEQPQKFAFIDNADAVYLEHKHPFLLEKFNSFEAIFVTENFVIENFDLDTISQFIRNSLEQDSEFLNMPKQEKEINAQLRQIAIILHETLKKIKSFEEKSLIDALSLDDAFLTYSLFRVYISIENNLSDASKTINDPWLKSIFMRFMRSFADHIAMRVHNLDNPEYLVPFNTILDNLYQIAKGDPSQKEVFIKKHGIKVFALSCFSMLCYGVNKVIKNITNVDALKKENDKVITFFNIMQEGAIQIKDPAWIDGVNKVYDSVIKFKEDKRTKTIRFIEVDKFSKIQAMIHLYIASSYFAQLETNSLFLLKQSFDTFFKKGGSYFYELCEQLTDIEMPKMMFALLPINKSLVDKIEYSSLKDEVKKDWKFFYTQVVAFHDALKNRTCYTSAPGHLTTAYTGSSPENVLFKNAYDTLSPSSIKTCTGVKFFKESRDAALILDSKNKIISVIKDLYLFAQAVYKYPKREDEVAIALKAMQLLSQIYVEFSMAVAK